MNASSIAPTLSARPRPSLAPRAAASIAFASVRSSSIRISPFVAGSSVSGYITFEIASAAGADITDAAIRCPAMSGKKAIRSPTKAAITPPATVAKPPVITACSSLLVMVRTYGFTSSGASVCPTKMFPAALRLSAPETPIVRCITQANAFTNICMTPT
jgi:hypothetical protein